MGKNKKVSQTEQKVVIVKKPNHLVNKDVTIDLNPDTSRYVLRQNGTFFLSDINQDTVRRYATQRFNLLESEWQEVKK